MRCCYPQGVYTSNSNYALRTRDGCSSAQIRSLWGVEEVCDGRISLLKKKHGRVRSCSTKSHCKNKWISKIKVQSSGGIERLKECVGEMWPSFNLGPVYTMKSKHGRWPFSMVQVHGSASMVRLLKNPVFKALGSSLGLNRMWIKKNDHAPKGECTECF